MTIKSLAAVLSTTMFVATSVARADEPAKKKLVFGGLEDHASLAADARSALETALSQVFTATTSAGDDAPSVAVTSTLEAKSGAVVLHLEAKSDPPTTLDRTLPTDDRAAAVMRAANELVARVDGLPVALVSISSTPAGATVLVDGQAFGKTPIPQTFVAPGAHKLAWHLDGRVDATRDVTYAAGDAKDETVSLAEDPAVIAAREKAKAEAAAEAKAKAEAEAKHEAEVKAERERLDAMEREAEAEAKAKALVEAAEHEAHENRRQLFAALFRFAGAVPSSDASAGLDALKVGAGDRLVYGGTLRSPLFWKSAYGAIDLDYWRDEYWSTEPPTGTPATARTIPIGMFSMDVTGGWRERLGEFFFADGGVSLGARRTRYARHETFQGGDPLDETSAKWSATAGLQIRAGVTYGLFEAALAWRLSVPIGGETPDATVGDLPSIGGLGAVNLFGVDVGVAY